MATTTTWTTTDLALAAWVATRSGPPVAVKGATWSKFTFDDSARCRDICVDYPASEAHRFDATVRALRKVALGHQWEGEPEGAVIRGFSLAAYAVVRGACLRGVTSEENGGRTMFSFLFDGDVDIDELAADWRRSECHAFDEWVRKLKRSKCQ